MTNNSQRNLYPIMHRDGPPRWILLNRLSSCGYAGIVNRRAAVRSPGTPQGSAVSQALRKAKHRCADAARHGIRPMCGCSLVLRGGEHAGQIRGQRMARSLTPPLSHGTSPGYPPANRRDRTSAGPRRSAGPGGESTQRPARATAMTGGLALAPAAHCAQAAAAGSAVGAMSICPSLPSDGTRLPP